MPTAILEPTTNHQQLVPAQASVLVVDDEEQNRILLKDPLEARGLSGSVQWQCIRTGSGEIQLFHHRL